MPDIADFINQGVQAISNLLVGSNKELITLLRTPSPIKVTKTITVDPSGCIGGGFDQPNPVDLYRCPMSAEAWLHIISITVPDYGPAQPLEQGQILCSGTTAGEPIFFLPLRGDVAPIQMKEGRLSAPHLNNGEAAVLVGDQLPPGISMRFDLQVVLVTGLSQYTPRISSPSNLDARTASDKTTTTTGG